MTDHGTIPQSNYPPRLILLGLALLLALWYTWHSAITPYEMGHDQTYVGTMLAKDRDPTLFPRDFAFHDDTLYRSYIPLIRGLLHRLIDLTGSFDAALLALVPVAVFFFTWGTGLLLYEWCGSLGVALILTILAVPYRPAPSGEIWGAGGVEFMLARTLATSLAPFLLLSYFRLLASPAALTGAALMLATGSLAFIHPPTALFLGELFLALFILCHGRDHRQWLVLAVMLGAYAIAAYLPLTMMERQAPTPVAALDFPGIRQVVHSYLKIPTDWGHFPGDQTERRVWLFLGATLVLGLNYLLRPVARDRTARQAWVWGSLVILYICWRLAGKGAGFSWLYLVAALYVLGRWRQEDLTTKDWWLLGMGFVVLAISILPYYFLTLLWQRFDSLWLTSLVIEHYRAVRLIHPFFYLFSARAAVWLIEQSAARLATSPRVILGYYWLLALTMTSHILFGLTIAAVVGRECWRAWPGSRRFLLGGVGGLLLLASVSLAIWPQLRTDVWTALRRDLPWPRATVDLRPEEELYAWARDNTPKDALFYYGSPLFRFRAQRSITHAQGDLINHREARYVEIFRRYQRLEQAYAEAGQLARLAQELQADYVVIPKTRPVRLPYPLVFENERYLVYHCPRHQ